MVARAAPGARQVRDDITVVWRSDPRLLRTIRGMIRCYVEDAGFSAEKAGEVVLAVDETCTNAIRHSYRGQTDERIDLALRSARDWLEIEIQDEGIPAPSERITRKQAPTPDIDSLQPGGLGVQLMYIVFDEVSFSPGTKQGNCVTMRLKRPGNAT